MSINEPEPAPAPVEGPACWDRAIEEWMDCFARSPFETDPKTHAKILTAFLERDELGVRTYGVRLRPHDGRNSLVDAAQELMDALVYLTKHQMEGGEVHREIAVLQHMIFNLFQRLEKA